MSILRVEDSSSQSFAEAEPQASDLFLAFDTDGSGGIDEKEFMKALFPLDYRRMYRRASGVTFGA